MLFRLQDVWKGYGGTEILKGVSFQVNPNEKVGLVGRNGAGKTTVFRIITGQEAPDDGEFDVGPGGVAHGADSVSGDGISDR